MAFDQATRNRLQRFVNEARNLLTEEFTRQLQRDYGMDPKTGEVAEIAKLSDLDDRRLETARILREIAAHYLATESASGHAADRQVLDRIVREQAFTVLNRLAALRMAEARSLLIESVGNGYQAKGFQLYVRLAGTGLGETGDAYRVYLFSVFDELAQDLPGLFDRYSPQGRLFPREAALLQVLNLINDADIAPLWSEDETIGWIYQYFNSKEERKAMRDASQAPRNSRELAVRNQFFTPRYVVEFLVDNTLGRLWFNATGGQTSLRERCQYLLVKPDEAPQAATQLRDPRTLKLLDPACGSMHFGLYAFDLFAEIYREAWAWEQQHSPGSLDHSLQKEGTQPKAALKPLSHTYEDETVFLRDVPRLIIEHNIYGVDIDPRAAQIASLALWLRAQRAWHDAGVKAKDRPLVGSGHVAAAIAPPAERELRKQFAANLDQRDAELFEKTLQMLKGLPELGVLLQVERELPHLIRQVYVGKGTGLFAQQEQEDWQQAEARLRRALAEFAQAAKSTYQGRLFAQDALQGLRLIDLCREVFDVVVMNPPFGLVTERSFSYFVDRYPDTYVDVYGCFVERGWELLRHGGYVGAITSRTFIGSKKLIRWREKLLDHLVVVGDLGNGVMDDALVMSAAYVVAKNESSTECISFGDLRREVDKESSLQQAVRNKSFKEVERAFFRDLPGGKLIYGAPGQIATMFKSSTQLEPTIATVRKGLTTFDDFRYLRLRWEIPGESIGKGNKWEFLAKGGEYSVYYTDIHLVVKRENNGSELAETNRLVNGQVAQSRQASSFYYLPGSQFTSRSASGFSARAIPAECTWSSNAPMILSQSNVESSFILGWVNSRLIRTLIEMQSTADDYVPNSLKCLPWVDVKPKISDEISSTTTRLVAEYRQLEAWLETDPYFQTPFHSDGNLNETPGPNQTGRNGKINEIQRMQSRISSLIDQEYNFDSSDIAVEVLERDVDEECPTTPIDLSIWTQSILSYCVGVAFGRFDWRLATGERSAPPEPDPFSPLPAKSPGMLPDGAAHFHAHEGILVDDQGHLHDLARLVEEVLVRVESPVPDDVRRWLGRDFFTFHLQRYSKSRRKAPIYWPLATAWGSYTLWVYYPSFTSQTLYTAINDFVEPKLKDVGEQVAALRAKGSARSRHDEKQFEALQAFELELIELRNTLLKIAPAYRPNHDDGVQITAAPLWPLFRHKPWQKVLKETWAKLENGDYDWAHLAMNYWPDRVREKCKNDKSLAIAHGLEELYEEPSTPAKVRGRRKMAEGE